MKTKICPKCGAEHAIDVDYCGCGHKWKKYQQIENVKDPLNGCCEVQSMAGRCHYAGVHSDSTTGGGPWKCDKHYKDSEGMKTDEIIYESQDSIKNVDYTKDARKTMSLMEFHKTLQNSPSLTQEEKQKSRQFVAMLQRRMTSW